MDFCAFKLRSFKKKFIKKAKILFNHFKGIVNHKSTAIFQNRGESSGTPGTRTSNVLPDLLSQASPATPPRHDKSSSEEVRFSLLKRILYPVVKSFPHSPFLYKFKEFSNCLR